MAKSILIVGAGRFGRYSAQKLHELGHALCSRRADWRQH